MGSLSKALCEPHEIASSTRSTEPFTTRAGLVHANWLSLRFDCTLWVEHSFQADSDSADPRCSPGRFALSQTNECANSPLLRATDVRGAGSLVTLAKPLLDPPQTCSNSGKEASVQILDLGLE